MILSALIRALSLQQAPAPLTTEERIALARKQLEADCARRKAIYNEPHRIAGRKAASTRKARNSGPIIKEMGR